MSRVFDLPSVRSTFAVLISMVMLGVLGARPGWAQSDSGSGAEPPLPTAMEDLPTSLLTTEGTLSDEQIDRLEDYISGWAKRLCNSDSPRKIQEARQKLLSPVTDRLSRAAVINYAIDAIASAIQPCMDEGGKLVQLNTLIVASQLPVDDVAEICVKGFAGQSPAVRYWAARTMTSVTEEAGADLFSTEQQQNLLEALTQAIPNEDDEAALQQMFQAMSGLQLPEAQTALLDVMEKRVETLAEGPDEGLRADQKTLSNLQTQLAVQQANGQDIDQRLRRLVQITSGYLFVTAHALQRGNVSEQLRPISLSMIGTVEEVFQFALTHFDSNYEGDAPPLVQPAQTGEFDLLLVNALDWVGTEDSPGVLQESQINVAREDLKLIQPPGGPSEGDPTQQPNDEGDDGDGDSADQASQQQTAA